MPKAESPDLRSRLRGMFLAGACGDALGAPLEFLTLSEIERRYGRGGPEAYVEGEWPRGFITDDTQMTLFTAEGMLRSVVRGLDRGMCNAAGVVHSAYLRWLHTQGVKIPRFEADPRAPDGWLVQQTFLHEPRVPGNTCLSALRASMDEFRQKADNDSKGCGSVMRTAPVAAWDLSPYGFDAFEEGCAYAALTHAHPTGILAAGFQSRVLALLLQGVSLGDATGRATTTLRRSPTTKRPWPPWRLPLRSLVRGNRALRKSSAWVPAGSRRRRWRSPSTRRSSPPMCGPACGSP